MNAAKLIPTLFAVTALCAASHSAWAQAAYPQESEEMEFATQLLGQSQYESAAFSYENFIQQFPHSSLLPNAYVGAGDSYFFQKEPEKALEYYQRYENQFPNGKEKWLVLLREGQCLYMNGKQDEAISKLKAIDPGSIQPAFKQTYYFYWGMALMDRGRLKEAAENFEKVVQEKSTGEYTTMAYLHLADILARLGKDGMASELYDSAVQSGDSMNVRAQIELIKGMGYLKSKQYDMAAIGFEKIVTDYPTLPVARDAAVDWFIALLRSNQIDQIISEYNQRFKGNYDDPLTGPIHLIAADALLIQKQNDEAMDILNTLIASPGMSQKTKDDASLKKAQIMAGTNHFNEALDIINADNSSDKDTRNSLELLKGQSYLGLQDYDKAWQVYSQAAQQTPDKAAAFCGQANIRHAQGQDAQSAGLFMECFNKSTDASYRQEALFSAFLMYEKANMVDEAIHTSKLYQANFPQGPHINEIVFGLADSYSQNKKYDQAIEILRTINSSSSYESQREALFQVAYNLQLGGKTDEALKLYRVIISQNTDPQLTLMSLKNSALIYSQRNDQDNTAQLTYRIVTGYPSNDFPTEDYLWLLEYWHQKHDPQRMTDVLQAVKKRPVEGSQQLGIAYFTAEVYRLENDCSKATPLYKNILDASDNPYKERSQQGSDKCRGKSSRT